MVRDFSDEPVAPARVEQLLINATRIPSAGYSQGFAFVVLTDPGQRRLFWETTSGPEWRGESESESLTRSAGRDPPAGAQTGVPRPLRDARQSAHPVVPRGVVAGAVLGHRYRLRRHAHSAHRRRPRLWAHCSSPSSPASRSSWTPWVCRRAIARSAPSPSVIPAQANAAGPSSPRAADASVMSCGGSTGDRPDQRGVSQLAVRWHDSIGAPTTTLRSSRHDQSPLTSAVEPAVHWPRRQPRPSQRRAARNRP